MRATAALTEAVKEAEYGPWEVGAGLKKEALRTWLGEQVARMDKLEESLDQKGGRMAKGAPAREKQGSAEEGLQCFFNIFHKSRIWVNMVETKQNIKKNLPIF